MKAEDIIRALEDDGRLGTELEAEFLADLEQGYWRPLVPGSHRWRWHRAVDSCTEAEVYLTIEGEVLDATLSEWLVRRLASLA